MLLKIAGRWRAVSFQYALSLKMPTPSSAIPSILSFIIFLGIVTHFVEYHSTKINFIEGIQHIIKANFCFT